MTGNAIAREALSDFLEEIMKECGSLVMEKNGTVSVLLMLFLLLMALSSGTFLIMDYSYTSLSPRISCRLASTSLIAESFPTLLQMN